MFKQQSWWQQRKLEIIDLLSDSDVERLESQTQKLNKKPGDQIWLENEGRPQLYIVDEGYIRLCHLTDDGRRFVLSILGPGEFFGAITPDVMTVEDEEYFEAVTEIRLFALDAALFQDVLGNYPALSARLAQLLELKKRALQKQMTSILFKDTTARTASLLLDIVDRYGVSCSDVGEGILGIALTHQEVSDMVGAARPVVSGILSKMVKANLICKSGKNLCLLNLEGLKQVAQEGAEAL